jgi:hypothetical protein
VVSSCTSWARNPRKYTRASSARHASAAVRARNGLRRPAAHCVSAGPPPAPGRAHEACPRLSRSPPGAAPRHRFNRLDRAGCRRRLASARPPRRGARPALRVGREGEARRAPSTTPARRSVEPTNEGAELGDAENAPAPRGPKESRWNKGEFATKPRRVERGDRRVSSTDVATHRIEREQLRGGASRALISRPSQRRGSLDVRTSRHASALATPCTGERR